MSKTKNAMTLPDQIVRQVQDEAAQAGDYKMVAICDQVLAHSFATSSDKEDDQYDRNIAAIRQSISDAAAQA